MVPKLMIWGLNGVGEIRPGDNLGRLIVDASISSGINLENGDVVVVTHVAVSKAEDRVFTLDHFRPSEESMRLAAELSKDPRHVEAILRESVKVVRMERGVIITKTRHGFICANSGVDLSNVGEGMVALLPEDPDASARRIRLEIRRASGVDVAVIISDSFGRPFRRGTVNVAVGSSGLEAIWDRRGEPDRYGRPLRSKQVCVADELAAAAGLVMGQAAEGVPVAIIRGYPYRRSEESCVKRDVVRGEDEDLFL
ncbi:MAG: coenzyme F420-0:L-glutamate ligase [Aigarchaeota archaeon]|nr:coenzyme F420-0:L-glutamate ligase [Aigarchaeota archaeon]MDW8093121.1 coenzyme F420-0:L-glutamate ligase [Nitrososphaerota archaeon]